MNLKGKIVRLLKESNYTYKDLAQHLSLTEAELDHAFETKTVEIRTLELISKELRIPLYSFFRDPEFIAAYGDKEPYYNVNIWSDQEVKLKTDIKDLKKQLDTLKSELKKREALIEALENQMKPVK
jgi:transcriptional regulator with XRE-family HTH domain